MTAVRPPKTKMVLMGGEKDGWEVEIVPAELPQVFFAVPYSDDDRIVACKSTKAKAEMRDKLARLAYKFDPEHSNSTRFKMVRCPELDRVSQS